MTEQYDPINHAAHLLRAMSDELRGAHPATYTVRQAMALLDQRRPEVQAVIDDLDRKALEILGDDAVTISQAAQLARCGLSRIVNAIDCGDLTAYRNPDAPNPRRGGRMLDKYAVLAWAFAVIVVDADGTLTAQRDGSCGDFTPQLLPNVAAVCAQLRAYDIPLAIASNQSVNRPLPDIHDQLSWTAEQIGASTWRFATRHTPERYKPSPGMLTEIAEACGASESKILFVGDQDTDRQAAEACGCAFAWAADFFRTAV
jgi:HAD superfamily hydrolase (TIGR01662 family)